MMTIAYALLMTAALGAGSSNLVVNPRFEEVEGALPARWHVFVMPQEGAYARLDDRDAYAGDYALVLHTPQEYEKDPVNNWSQNIVADVGGQEVIVRGQIKTRDVTEAALWLQSFSAYPRRLAHFATSSDETPLYGDNDWTPVEMRVQVPEGVNLLVLRCIIKGRGTAWFDDLSVSIAEERITEADPTPGMTLGEREPALPVEPAVPPLTWPEGRDDLDDPVIESYRMMVDTYWELWDENANLVEELFTLRQQVFEMREAMAELEALAPITPSAEQSAVPPLIPRTRPEEELSP